MSDAHTPMIESAWAPRAEHICLESDEIVVDRSLGGAKVGPSLTVGNPLRGCETEVAVRDDHKLLVRSRRQRSSREYLVDLRFVEGTPLTRLHIAWGCWLAALLSVATAVALRWPEMLPAGVAWPRLGWPAALALAAVAACLVALAVHRSYESIRFVSAHGRITLVELTGRLGCSRDAAPFSALLARRVADARARAPQSQQQFLRDEMREHRRLFEDGVLPEPVYEAGKQRILKAHA